MRRHGGYVGLAYDVLVERVKAFRQTARLPKLYPGTRVPTELSSDLVYGGLGKRRRILLIDHYDDHNQQEDTP